MNKLIDMGVAGFSVHVCKHMWPEDLRAVYGHLNNLNTKWFSSGSKPFIYYEVPLIVFTMYVFTMYFSLKLFSLKITLTGELFQVNDLGGGPILSSEYTGLGRVTEYKYGAKLGNVLRKWNGEKAQGKKGL